MPCLQKEEDGRKEVRAQERKSVGGETETPTAEGGTTLKRSISQGEVGFMLV
jgi:hypothetical protein